MYASWWQLCRFHTWGLLMKVDILDFLKCACVNGVKNTVKPVILLNLLCFWVFLYSMFLNSHTHFLEGRFRILGIKGNLSTSTIFLFWPFTSTRTRLNKKWSSLFYSWNCLDLWTADALARLGCIRPVARTYIYPLLYMGCLLSLDFIIHRTFCT